MTTTKSNNNDYYFWLGEDGEPEFVTEEIFEEEQRNLREALEKWKGVVIEDEGIDVVS